MKTKKVTFKCEIITPMFIGDATGGAELRPPAIKAALRFWWRAMNAHLSLDALRQKELEIFGGGGDEAKASPFTILIDNIKGEAKPYNNNNDSHNPKKPFNFIDNEKDKDIGLKYFFYTFLHLKKEGSCLPVGTTFDVQFQFTNEETIKPVLAAFWLLVHLGNIGSRARRGAGSFGVSDHDDTLLKLNFGFIDEIDYTNELTKIKSLIGTGIAVTNSYSNLLNAAIFISKPFKSWEIALNDIGVQMKNFRLHNSDLTISNSNGHLKKENSAAFGLPLRHSNRASVWNKSYKRRSSPIMIKIIKTNNNDYNWVLCYFKELFLPKYQDKLKLGNSSFIANERIIQKFVETLKNSNKLTL